MAIYPCRNCVYIAACGSTTRTEPCKGRQTKTERKSFLEQLNSEMTKLNAREKENER